MGTYNARRDSDNLLNIYRDTYICIFLIDKFGIRFGSHDLDNDVIGAS